MSNIPVIKEESINVWVPDEEIYLNSILVSCEKLSNDYLVQYRKWKFVQASIKIPVIIVGSFTGITSFGTETFPLDAQKWISIGVGIITVGIAILNTIESYFKVGENANSSLNTSVAFQQLREDINKELSIPEDDRSAPGVTFLRDVFTRYQQIISQAPTLDDGAVTYIDKVIQKKINVMIKKNDNMYNKKSEEIDNMYGINMRKSSDVSTKSDGFLGRMKQMMTLKGNTPAITPTLPQIAKQSCSSPIFTNEKVKDDHKLNNDLYDTLDNQSDVQSIKSLRSMKSVKSMKSLNSKLSSAIDISDLRKEKSETASKISVIESDKNEIVFVDNHIPKDVIPDNEAPLGKASNYSSNCPEFDDAIDIDENNKKL